MHFFGVKPMYYLVFTILIYAVRIAYRTLTRYRTTRRLGCKEPPSPPQHDWLFGLDFVYQQIVNIQKDHRNASIRELHEELGNTFLSKFYGSRKIHTIERLNVQAVMSTNFESWGVQPLSIMGTDGRLWEHYRALLRPAFARKEISDLPSLETHVKSLLDKIPGDGSTNVFTRDFKLWASCKAVHSFVEARIDAIAQAAKDDTSHYVLARELLKETADRTTIRNELLNVFLPTHEATGVALTNIFFNIARHPEVWNKLRAETLAVPPGQEITFESLQGMRYLQTVVNESCQPVPLLRPKSLRLNPSIGTSRIALRETTLPIGDGSTGDAPIYIRKGDIFSINFYSLHRRKDLFGDDAEDQQMALTQAAYTIVRFLQKFKHLQNRDTVWELQEQYTLSTQSKNGAKVAFTAA
ncbi:cytochrome P450 [Bimuria novae-zelandiae CBS 107.79]|uniref:Cytochrome P450 n=1 Tax=Bimuria novae-zelandiae CBS 107.79 TaxID=1447943 RepID=A0A6A5VGP1_9PLEO|nr:cytochrome P450 [Bimuria novae-zelandiae CBS 107.79]